MRSININPLSFIASPEEKKFILLRSEKADQDEKFLLDYAMPKISNFQNANQIPGVWGTIGYKSDKPIDWIGNIECSNEGNADFDKHSELYKEIEYIKYMYPTLNLNEDVKEKVIDLRSLDINMPPIFSFDEIPEIRLDIFLDEDEGALAFYQLRRSDVAEKDIEFIQPQPTKAHTINRDRLTYHVKVIPKKLFHPIENIPNKFELSNENSEDDFIIKVIIFKRKYSNGQLPSNSNQLIELLEKEIEKKSNKLFAKKHKLLIFNPKSKDFVNVKKGSIKSDLKTLFLIHGTFVSTKGSFGEVYPWIESLLNEGLYRQVIAFDHPTLFDDAEENTLELFKQFKKFGVQAFTQSVDLIGTSQGGLFAQFLANFPNSYLTIGKVALVASANGVGYLSLANNLSKGLKLMRKVFRKIGFEQAALISALLQHSIKWVIDRKGLDLMRPGSDALRKIMFNTPINENTRYWPVIGNFSASKWGGRALEKAIDLTLDDENDWVVGTKNQFKVPSEYCAIPEYNPGKYRDHAILGKNALHGRLIEDSRAQKQIARFFEDEHYLDSSIDEADDIDLFDAHCHLFGRSVVNGRIILLLLADLINYFNTDNKDELIPPITLREDEKTNPSSLNTTLINILKYFILNNEANDMLHDLEKEYYGLQSNVYRYIPLMFDLEMTFKNSYDRDDSHGNLVQLATNFAEKHNKMLNKIDSMLDAVNKGTKVFSGSQSEIDGSIKIIRNIKLIIKQLSSLTDTLSKDTKESFHKQIDELQRLKISYGNDLFPFLATDPRRTNMSSYIEGQVGKGKTFYGIKLYTPNGYSPTDPHLFKREYAFIHSTSLYQWCIDSNTPIMAHNSDAGFATFTDRLEVFGDICNRNQTTDNQFILEYKDKEFIDFNFNIFKGGFDKTVKERAHTLNHPTIWRKVLTEYPNLKICFAHLEEEVLNGRI